MHGKYKTKMRESTKTNGAWLKSSFDGFDNKAALVVPSAPKDLA
jgi:hypothetical protein